MSPQSKREYLAAIVKRYRAASRKIKSSNPERVLFNLRVSPKACPQASADLPAIHSKDSGKTRQKAGV